MSVMLSFSRRRTSCILLTYPRFLRRFSVDVNPAPGSKPESQESIVAQILENLRKIPQRDWVSSESLGSLLVSSSSVSLSQITRRLGSYSLAVSFLEFLDAKSQSLKRREEYLSLVFQSVIEFAGSEPDARDKLLRLYEISKEKNIPLTLVATKLLIRWFGRMGMVDQSVLVYEQLDSNSKTTQVRNVVIDVFFRNRLLYHAFKVLNEMLYKDSVFRPSRITADIVFSEVWRGRRHSEEEIASLISRFSSHGVSPNTVWLTRFITSLCRNSRTDVAWEILSDLMKKKAPLEAPPFNALLTCFGRKMEIGGMNAIVKKMDEMGIKPDVVTLGILINSLCKSWRVDEALEVFERMCGKKTDGNVIIKANSIHYNTLIDGFCKEGRMKEAEDLFVRMKKEETCAPNTITYNCLIDGYCRAEKLETAEEVVTRMKEDGIKPDVVTHNTYVRVMCRLGCVFKEASYLRDMVREGVIGNVASYLTIIQGCFRERNFPMAMLWFDKMLEDGYSPDASIYYALISGVCQTGRDHDVVRVVEKLKQSGFVLDLVAYNMLFEFFCEKNNRKKVCKMHTDMEAARMKPDSITYNTLISYFCRINDLESVQTLMENMREDGLDLTGVIIEAYCSAGNINEVRVVEKLKQYGFVLDLVTYNMLLGFFCRKYNEKKVYEILTVMEAERMKPDSITYNTLISFFGRIKDFENVQMMMENMREDGLDPNVETYGVIMKAYCYAGNINEALKLFKDMGLRSKVNPNTVIYNILINGYSMMRNVKEALSLKEDMEERMVRPDVETYNILINKFSMMGNVKEALSLKVEMEERMVRPDVKTYNALFSCLNESSQKETLLKLINEMNQVSCEPDSFTHIILFKCLSLTSYELFLQGEILGSLSD